MHTTIQEKFIELPPTLVRYTQPYMKELVRCTPPTQVLPSTEMMPPTQEEISTMLHTLQYENSTMHPTLEE